MSDNDLAGSTGPIGDGMVAFDYVKSSDFRTIWADGAIGGITPSGLIHFALYSERPAIPRRQVFELVEDSSGASRLGQELPERRLSRDSIVREMPIDVILSVATAENLVKWLTEHIEMIKVAVGEK